MKLPLQLSLVKFRTLLFSHIWTPLINTSVAPAFPVSGPTLTRQTFANKPVFTMDKFVTRTRKDGTVVTPVSQALPASPNKAKSKPKEQIASEVTSSPAVSAENANPVTSPITNGKINPPKVLEVVSSLDPDLSAIQNVKRTPKKGSRSPASSPKKDATHESVLSDVVVDVVKKNEYKPSKDKYHPIKDACWRVGEKTPYIALAKTFEAIADESSSLAIIQIMANFLRSVTILSKQDTLRCVYLSLNRIAPAWENIELGVGESLLLKALAEATGKSLSAIKKLMQEKGDLGEVAAHSRLSQTTLSKPKALTVEGVFNAYKEISAHSGHQAQQQKVNKIKSLLVASSDPCEARFILRSLTGKMRIGLAEQNMLAAIALAAHQTPPNQVYPPAIIDASARTITSTAESTRNEVKQQIKTAYNLMPNYDKLIEYLLEGGMKSVVENCTITPGVPVKPMLAKPTTGVDDVLASLGNTEDFVCEWKYDGERAQLHRTNSGVYHIYSRNLENHTDKYPDVLKIAPKIADANVVSFILDSEVVAWDIKTGEILPFQVLTTRKRKRDGDAEVKVEVQVCVFAFDLLYLNGESLIERPLAERRELLLKHFTPITGHFAMANGIVTHDSDAMQHFLNEAVEGRCEGLMVKQLNATYEVAHRSNKWLKLKKDYIQGLGDSVDCVVMGAFYGTGKRTGVYGSYLLGVYDTNAEEYQTICKLGTGFSDEVLTQYTAELKQHVVDKPKGYYRIGGLTPDVWFEPSQVWEVKAADLSILPVHTAAIGLAHEAKGISLRFPRFIRVRDDKQPEECTPAEVVYEMYQKQSERTSAQRDKKKKSGKDSDSDGGY